MVGMDSIIYERPTPFEAGFVASFRPKGMDRQTFYLWLPPPLLILDSDRVLPL